MTSEELKRNINIFLNNYFRNDRENIALRIAKDLKAQVQLRVQTSGLNSEGRPFEPYVPRYKAQRKKKGFQPFYFDMTRSGEYWADVKEEVVNSNPNEVTIQIGPTRQNNINKALGQVKKRGNILIPSDEELELAFEAWVESITNRLQTTIQ